MSKLLKNKWFSITLVSVLASGLLVGLVLLVLKVSGAWFTDSASKTIDPGFTAKFGNIELENNLTIRGYDYLADSFSEAEQITNLVPTQAIGYRGTGANNNIKYVGDVEAYYRITFWITDATDAEENPIPQSSEDEDEMTIEKLESQFSFSNAVGEDKSVVYGKVSGHSLINKGYLLFNAEADNSYTSISFTIHIKIDCIQANNITNIDGNNVVNPTNGMTREEYDALFEAYDEFANPTPEPEPDPDPNPENPENPAQP